MLWEQHGVQPPRVSILTRPWGRVQRLGGVAPHATPPRVSILTRPWGRVQLECIKQIRSSRQVSILTRPWERVQRY